MPKKILQFQLPDPSLWESCATTSSHSINNFTALHNQAWLLNHLSSRPPSHIYFVVPLLHPPISIDYICTTTTPLLHLQRHALFVLSSSFGSLKTRQQDYTLCFFCFFKGHQNIQERKRDFFLFLNKKKRSSLKSQPNLPPPCFYLPALYLLPPPYTQVEVRSPTRSSIA